MALTRAWNGLIKKAIPGPRFFGVSSSSWFIGFGLDEVNKWSLGLLRLAALRLLSEGN